MAHDLHSSAVGQGKIVRGEEGAPLTLPGPSSGPGGALGNPFDCPVVGETPGTVICFSEMSG